MANGNGSTPIAPRAPRTNGKPPARPAVEVGLRVSLIPADEPVKKDPRVGFRRFVLATVSGIGILALITAGIWVRALFAGREVLQLDAETEQVVQEQKALAASLREAKLLQSQLKGVAQLVKTHRSGVGVLEFFEKHTLPTVAFSSATVAENGMVTLSAEATDYESFAAEVGELRSQSLVRSVVVSGINAEYGVGGDLSRVRFTLTVNFDPAIFLHTAPVAATP